MTDNNDHAQARAAMAQDAAEVADRDQTAWELNVQSTEATVAMSRAQANYANAKGAWWVAFAQCLNALRAIGWIAFIYVLAFYALEALR